MSDDPTRITNQPALTTSTGRVWLVVGGIFTAVALAVLVPMSWLAPGIVALIAAIVVFVLYLSMIAVRLWVPQGRRRLGLLAIGMLAIALVTLVAAAIVVLALYR
jgi:O-antigen/teichoic acid export membrane protein